MKKYILFGFLTFVFGSHAIASGQNEINGFHYQTCNDLHCVDVFSNKAWISQLDGGFATEGATSVSLLDRSSGKKQSFSGTRLSFLPKLQLLSFESEGKAVFISLNDFSVQKASGGKL